MQTHLIDGRPIPITDAEINEIINPPGTAEEMQEFMLRLAIENDDGEIYRIAATGDVITFSKTVKRLRQRGYWIEPTDGEFIVIVKQPDDNLPEWDD